MATETMEITWGTKTEAWANRSRGEFREPSQTASSSENSSTATIMTMEYTVVFFIAMVKASEWNILV